MSHKEDLAKELISAEEDNVQDLKHIPEPCLPRDQFVCLLFLNFTFSFHVRERCHLNGKVSFVEHF